MEISKLKGINEKRAKELNKVGIESTEDFISQFPRRYLDLRNVCKLENCYHNDMVLTTGKIVSVPQNKFSYKRIGYVKVMAEQEGVIFTIIWFNQPYVVEKLVVGEEYLFYGRVQNKTGVTLVNPSFEPIEKNFRLKGIVPQYSTPKNFPQKTFRDAVKLSVNIERPESIIPIKLQEKYGLSSLLYAYHNVHNPESFEQLAKASERIAIEEYFGLISAFKIIKTSREQVRINEYSCKEDELKEFILGFPFEFTNGQKKAVSEIFADLKGKKAMNRLLQGDVGSGKTAVSMCAIFMAVKSGYQAVMLAPTEVLAKQNYELLKRIFKPYGINVDFLSGSMKEKEKRAIKGCLKLGITNILVGTHAVLEDDVEFKNLALCVCDEQQRFGVSQRSKLFEKGDFPDLLVMSATPIPRTLSLIFYGDLDVSTIPDKPSVRIPIQTNIVPYTKYNDMLKFIENEVQKGNQIYFVCPKVEEDEEGEVMSVTELYEELKERLSFDIAVIHGKMKDKVSVMEDFKNKKYMGIVSTTVIETGVDVKDANIMVIYNAERFGLSQLHQLRGRIGRGDKQSYCFLLTNTNSEKGIERLKIIRNNTDGFKISEYDFDMRGAGDFMGQRQSGKTMTDLGYLNYSVQSIFLAKKISDEAFNSQIDIEKIKNIALKRQEKLKDIIMN
ncbi:MAG: ATP-dependent DNA helicase RecG [Clostridiales bacterium]|nr:ATP-dependent DNA helicase RecG [Clostridiales bacterium]